MQREAEVDAIVTGWTKERTKQEAMAQLSAVGVPAGAVLDTQELIDEPSFYERGILQQMTARRTQNGDADLASAVRWRA